MKDYSIENKIKLLKEIGYFPKNNFCNLTGVENDIKHLNHLGIDAEYDGWYIKFNRKLKTFFRFGATIKYYSHIIYPIARYYLAIEKEGKNTEIDYSFEEYIKINLKDTYDDYKKLINHKEVIVNDCYSEELKTTVIEEAYKIDFLNTQIAENKKNIILYKIKELILEYYKEFDFDVFENWSNGNSQIIYDYLCDDLKEMKNGEFINSLTDKLEIGDYYPFYESEGYNIGYSIKEYVNFIFQEKENLYSIQSEIDNVIKKYDVNEEEVEYIDYIEKSIYTDEEVINFIKKHPIWDREFLNHFYPGIDNIKADELISFYNYKIWDTYDKDKLDYDYHYYYFDKHLERQSMN